MHPVVLTIAGSDCSAGAGIQADLATFQRCGVYGVSAVTAVVAQRPGHVAASKAVDPELLAAQLDEVAQAFPLAAAKTGMLASAENVQVVADFFEQHADIPLVIDPVFKATAGASLLPDSAVDLMKQSLFPRAQLVTPNLPEFDRLGSDLKTNVLVKGGHASGDQITDKAFIDGEEYRFTRQRLKVPDLHGTGCTLSAAIAAALGMGMELIDAIDFGIDDLTHVMEHFHQWGDTAALGRLSD
ncbi:MAG: hydroxymethylpyrimidine/phosphomethylpyrimidine kinase [Verrucomicrobiota bacterium]